MWTIEKIVSKGEYNYAVVRNHPFRTKNDYVLEHRVVMENHIGRLLRPDELVHHIDENKKNNDISNLEIQSWPEHSKHHAQAADWLELKCAEVPENNRALMIAAVADALGGTE